MNEDKNEKKKSINNTNVSVTKKNTVGAVESGSVTKTSGSITSTGRTKKKGRRNKRPSTSRGSNSGSNNNKSNSNYVRLASEAVQAKKTISSIMKRKEEEPNDVAWLSKDRLSIPPASINNNNNDNDIRRDMDDYYGHGGGREVSNLLRQEEMQIVDAALLNNGMSRADISLEAIGCLLEQARRYGVELINEAQEWANHRTEDLDQTSSSNHNPILAVVNSSDLLMAAENRDDVTLMSTLPPPSHLMELAEDVNRSPLPPIPNTHYNGLVLPDEQFLLTGRTFDVVSTNQTVLGQNGNMSGVGVPIVEGGRNMTDNNGGNNNNKVSTNSATKEDCFENCGRESEITSYGANRGRQIAINLKNNDKEKASEGVKV